MRGLVLEHWLCVACLTTELLLMFWLPEPKIMSLFILGAIGFLFQADSESAVLKAKKHDQTQ